MAEQYVLRDDHGKVRILKINRPAQQNKLNIACMDELRKALQDAESDESCRAIVLCGVGEHFCNGGELGDYRSQSPVDLRRFGNSFIKVHTAISNLAKPVIAAVQGDVAGGGLNLLEACDLAVASEDANFSVPEITLGIAPMMALTGVTRIKSRKGAMQMALLGEAVDARQALAMGLVNWICPRCDVMPMALKIAIGLAERNPVAVSLCKKL